MSHNGKICARCNIELRVKKNGVIGVEMGTQGPLAVFEADLWHCPGCNYEALLGFAKEPIVAHDMTKCEERIVLEEAAGKRVVRFWINEREREEFYREEIAREISKQAEQRT